MDDKKFTVWVNQLNETGLSTQLDKFDVFRTYFSMWNCGKKYPGKKIRYLHISDCGVHIYFEVDQPIERVILQEPAPPVTLSEQFVSSIPTENRGESRAEFEHDRFGQAGTTDLYESSKGSAF